MEFLSNKPLLMAEAVALVADLNNVKDFFLHINVPSGGVLQR